MVAEVIVTSRFNTLGQPNAAPGCCGICGSAAGPFVDPDRFIRSHGRFIICFSCVEQMAALLPKPIVEEQEPVPTLTREDFEEVVNDVARTVIDAANNLVDYLAGASVDVLRSEDIDSDATDSSVEPGDSKSADKPAVETKRTTGNKRSAGVSGDPGNGTAGSPFSLV